jgi:hypothetical protein
MPESAGKGGYFEMAGHNLNRQKECQTGKERKKLSKFIMLSVVNPITLRFLVTYCFFKILLISQMPP